MVLKSLTYGKNPLSNFDFFSIFSAIDKSQYPPLTRYQIIMNHINSIDLRLEETIIS